MHRLENTGVCDGINGTASLQIADLPSEEIEALWSEYVNAYAECLLKANNDPSSPAGKRLVGAQLSALHLCHACNQVSYGSMITGAALGLQSMRDSSVTTCAHLWPHWWLFGTQRRQGCSTRALHL